MGWRENSPKTNTPNRWWAHRESVSSAGWSLLADVTCLPAWDKTVEVKLKLYEPIDSLLSDYCISPFYLDKI